MLGWESLFWGKSEACPCHRPSSVGACWPQGLIGFLRHSDLNNVKEVFSWLPENNSLITDGESLRPKSHSRWWDIYRIQPCFETFFSRCQLGNAIFNSHHSGVGSPSPADVRPCDVQTKKSWTLFHTYLGPCSWFQLPFWSPSFSPKKAGRGIAPSFQWDSTYQRGCRPALVDSTVKPC